MSHNYLFYFYKRASVLFCLKIELSFLKVPKYLKKSKILKTCCCCVCGCFTPLPALSPKTHFLQRTIKYHSNVLCFSVSKAALLDRPGRFWIQMKQMNCIRSRFEICCRSLRRFCWSGALMKTAPAVAQTSISPPTRTPRTTPPAPPLNPLTAPRI